MYSRVIDLTGCKFNMLTVLCRAENDPYGKARWICQCDCGQVKVVDGGSLRKGKTKSCGCYKLRIHTERLTKHGKCKTKLYSIYRGMLSRCYYKKDLNFKNYGEKGIKVCKEWKDDFLKFYEWSLENGYREEILPNGRTLLTIDRIDSHKGYSPDNCRWITIQEQQQNKCTTVYLIYKGEKRTITDWAEKIGIDRNTLYDRIYVYGWTVEDAIEIPLSMKREEYRDEAHHSRNKLKRIVRDYGMTLKDASIKIGHCPTYLSNITRNELSKMKEDEIIENIKIAIVKGE